jgi:hypothetical protein
MSPRATSSAVVSKILYLRQQYHFGPGRIAAFLERFHQITIACSSQDTDAPKVPAVVMVKRGDTEEANRLFRKLLDVAPPHSSEAADARFSLTSGRRQSD